MRIARVVILDALAELAARRGVPAMVLGLTGGEVLDFGVAALELKAVQARYEATLPSALSYTITH